MLQVSDIEGCVDRARFVRFYPLETALTKVASGELLGDEEIELLTKDPADLLDNEEADFSAEDPADLLDGEES